MTQDPFAALQTKMRNSLAGVVWLGKDFADELNNTYTTLMVETWAKNTLIEKLLEENSTLKENLRSSRTTTEIPLIQTIFGRTIKEIDQELTEAKHRIEDLNHQLATMKRERDTEIDAHVITIKTLNAQRIGDQALVASEAQRLYIEHEYKKLGQANDAYIKLIDKYERQAHDYGEKVNYITDLAEARLSDIGALKRDLAHWMNQHNATASANQDHERARKVLHEANQTQYNRILMLERNIEDLNRSLGYWMKVGQSPQPDSKAKLTRLMEYMEGHIRKAQEELANAKRK